MSLPTPNAAARGAASSAASVPPGEDEADLRHRWNLADLYADEAAFDAARSHVGARLAELRALQGTLAGSPQALRMALDLHFETAKELARVSAYATMLSDEDTRDARALGARQEVQQLATEFASATAWLAPEVLALPEGAVAANLEAERGLAPYRFFLEDLLRQRAHTLSPVEERVLAEAGILGQAPYNLYTVLANADMPFAEVTLSDATRVRLDQAAYAKYRAAAKRVDRKLVFETFWSTFKEFERTFGVGLDAQVRRDAFYARARRYGSSLDAALDGSNVPVEVYRTLLAEAQRALPTLHRIFRLRGRMLGIENQRYYDVYPPVVPHLDRRFPVDRAEAVLLDALAPLGEPYTHTVAEGFASRWMDVFPSVGKRSGAYSSGSAYDVHPYVLLNYNDDYESVSTLAHEWGHAMHSHLANREQPYPTAGYSIFIAEVASTFNEALLLAHMLESADSDDQRLSLLGSFLENVRGTFFRQAMFAEFEVSIHEAVERGEALTGERLSEMYGKLLRRFHGHDEGVISIDDLYAVEWAYIPHFYYNFYVFQYATSLAASALLAREVLEGDEGARTRYLSMLAAGGSRYPYELLREAGVDLATAAPYRALIESVNRAMDEIERILARQRR
jgi:oligoendopeptidase F